MFLKCFLLRLYGLAFVFNCLQLSARVPSQEWFRVWFTSALHLAHHRKTSASSVRRQCSRLERFHSSSSNNEVEDDSNVKHFCEKENVRSHYRHVQETRTFHAPEVPIPNRFIFLLITLVNKITPSIMEEVMAEEKKKA